MCKWAIGSGSFLLCLWLSSCAHSPRQSARVPDWEADDAPGSAPRTSGIAANHIPNLPSSSNAGTATRPNSELENSSAPPSSLANPQPSEKGSSWVSLTSWCRETRLPSPVRLPGDSAPAFEVRGTNGVLVLRPGSHSALWEGTDLRLAYSPNLIDNQPFVHALDLQKTVEPLLFSSHIHVSAAKPVIVIDPGHGGENAGTRSAIGNHFEKDFTLDWAKRLGSVLEGQGWTVYLTRQGDNNLALSNRVSFADAHKADLFISLHFNSAGSAENEIGLETYCLTPAGLPSTVTRGYADETDVQFPNNGWDAQNLQFAYLIHHAVLRGAALHDRGIRRARFPGVLRNQKRPAILVEGGYLSNPAEARRIAEPQFRQRLAEAIAAGLANIWQAPRVEYSEHAGTHIDEPDSK